MSSLSNINVALACYNEQDLIKTLDVSIENVHRYLVKGGNPRDFQAFVDVCTSAINFESQASTCTPAHFYLRARDQRVVCKISCEGEARYQAIHIPVVQMLLKLSLKIMTLSTGISDPKLLKHYETVMGSEESGSTYMVREQTSSEIVSEYLPENHATVPFIRADKLKKFRTWCTYWPIRALFCNKYVSGGALTLEIYNLQLAGFYFTHRHYLKEKHVNYSHEELAFEFGERVCLVRSDQSVSLAVFKKIIDNRLIFQAYDHEKNVFGDKPIPIGQESLLIRTRSHPLNGVKWQSKEILERTVKSIAHLQLYLKEKTKNFTVLLHTLSGVIVSLDKPEAIQIENTSQGKFPSRPIFQATFTLNNGLFSYRSAPEEVPRPLRKLLYFYHYTLNECLKNIPELDKQEGITFDQISKQNVPNIVMTALQTTYPKLKEHVERFGPQLDNIWTKKV